MTLTRSTAPDFKLHNITWQCFVTEANTYEWRSTCGRYAVWREGSVCKARRGDRIGTYPHRNLISAMRAAQADRRAAA